MKKTFRWASALYNFLRTTSVSAFITLLSTTSAGSFASHVSHRSDFNGRPPVTKIKNELSFKDAFSSVTNGEVVAGVKKEGETVIASEKGKFTSFSDSVAFQGDYDRMIVELALLRAKQSGDFNVLPDGRGGVSPMRMVKVGDDILYLQDEFETAMSGLKIAESQNA